MTGNWCAPCLHLGVITAGPVTFGGVTLCANCAQAWMAAATAVSPPPGWAESLAWSRPKPSNNQGNGGNHPNQGAKQPSAG